MGLFDKEFERKRIETLPNWILTPAEEKQVLEEYQKEVWRNCDRYVQEFQKCEAVSGFAVLFKCKAEGNAMRACVDHYHQHEYVDQVRDAFIKNKLDKFAQEKAAKQG